MNTLTRVLVASALIAAQGLASAGPRYYDAPRHHHHHHGGIGLGGLVLGLATMSFITRITRATILEIKRQDYIRTARAKGLAERRVVLRHIMRNGLIPVVTLLGPALVDLATGSVITEAIFTAAE